MTGQNFGPQCEFKPLISDHEHSRLECHCRQQRRAQTSWLCLQFTQNNADNKLAVQTKTADQRARETSSHVDCLDLQCNGKTLKVHAHTRSKQLAYLECIKVS